MKNEDQVKILTDKVRIMQKPIDKKKYCGVKIGGYEAKIYVKEHQSKKTELQRRIMKVDEKTELKAFLLDKYKSQISQSQSNNQS